MSDLTRVPLGSLVVLVTDKMTVGKDPSKPYVGLEHIPSGGSLLIGTAPSAESVSTNNQFRAGDILFGKLRPRLRKSIRVDFAGYCSTDILVLRAIGSNDPAFAKFVVQSDSVFTAAIRTEEGTKMPRCSWGDLKDIGVICPTSPEQQRIAEVLTTVDEVIEQTEALIAKTQDIKSGLMHDLFTRGVTPNGGLRPSYKEAPQLYVESPLGWIPREWELARLGNKRAANRAHLKTGPFGTALKLEHWVEHGRPVITIGALGEGEFIESELLYVSDATAERLYEYQLAVGDVVFSRVADVGRSAVIHEPQQGWIMSSNLMRISLDQHQVSPMYLQAQLAYDQRVRRQIRATVNAGGRDVANSQILNRLDFAWPSRDEQERIIERLEGVEEQRRTNLEFAGKLRAQKMGLMRDLLTGRIRVSRDDVRAAAYHV